MTMTDWTDQSDRPKPPPYIHFTLHKTNRDTQDCLSHLSRALGCRTQDLTVCGTKDKRAVTVQRVCFKRSGKNLMGVWKGANGIRPGKKTERQAVEERGERGSRVGDLVYSDKYLELGMLKGNHFAITLRYVTIGFEGLNMLTGQERSIGCYARRNRCPLKRYSHERIRKLLRNAAIRYLDSPNAHYRSFHPSIQMVRSCRFNPLTPRR
jgi:hypothetical protein